MFDVRKYWDNRYREGGNSGRGSYGLLARFKSIVINRFMQDNDIKSVVEFGCGDGHQLALFKCDNYVGMDISDTAVNICREKFKDDATKQFYYEMEYENYMKKYDLALSLDVLYHIMDRIAMNSYLTRLFCCAEKFVIIYAYDCDAPEELQGIHYKPMKFTQFIEENMKDFELFKTEKNMYPVSEYGYDNGSFSNFYIYKRIK